LPSLFKAFLAGMSQLTFAPIPNEILRRTDFHPTKRPYHQADQWICHCAGRRIALWN
jgi:hypothetical protein